MRSFGRPATRLVPTRRFQSLSMASVAEQLGKPKLVAMVEETAEADSKVHILELSQGKRKIKGFGHVDTAAKFGSLEYGESASHSQRNFVRLPARLPELRSGMLRRAQTISTKDAGQLVARLGIGVGDRVLEAGLGSGGLSLNLARCLGNAGVHVTVEPRSEHAVVGLANLERARSVWAEFPRHQHVEGSIQLTTDRIRAVCEEFDAIVLDLPDHAPAIAASAPLLAIGGRLACYCASLGFEPTPLPPIAAALCTSRSTSFPRAWSASPQAHCARSRQSAHCSRPVRGSQALSPASWRPPGRPARQLGWWLSGPAS